MKTINIKQLPLALAIICASSWADTVTYTYDSLNRLKSVSYPSIGTITYNYDAAGNRLSVSRVAGQTVAPPTAATSAATDITATGATLNGNVNANGANTTVTFDYGLTVAYGTNAAASPASVAASAGSTVALTVSGLACNSTYHFRVKAVNSVGTTNGSDKTFNTLACPVAPPNAPTVNFVTVSNGNATIRFTPATGGGTATSYLASCTAAGQVTRSGSGTGSPIVVSGLTSGVTYACSVTAINSAGSSAPSAAKTSSSFNIIPILEFLLD